MQPPTSWEKEEDHDPEDDRITWHTEWHESEPHPFLTSATDLLLAWMPNGNRSERSQNWDRFFGAFETGDAGTGSLAPSCMPIQDSWDTESANSAVDCLLQFVHALERLDVEEAMTCLADDYHAIEAGCEVDRNRLRLRLESAFDSWRRGRIRVSLAEVPDPVFHPGGILIQALVQIDFSTDSGEEKTTELLRRLVVFRETAYAGWKIGALSLID
jgi:hypothetical protein